MGDNLKIWNAVKTPPQTALKEIKGGRLKGMTDISPQWRMMALTEQFGPAGIGWTYEVKKQWTESGPQDQIAAFVNVDLLVKVDGEWSRAIPGSGGAMLVVKESSGLHFSDEAFKMATTDAISVAAKALGVGSDVYMGQLDSKYRRQPVPGKPSQPAATSPDREAINNRIRHGLSAHGCKTAEDAAKKVKEMTGFKGRDGWVDGKDDYKKLSDAAAKILAEKLEKEKPTAEICNECRSALVDGACHNRTCPSCEPY